MSCYHLIYEKFGIPIDKAMELDVLTFNLLLRDAIVIAYSETEDGREYLNDCWRMNQTEPDFDELEKYKGGLVR